MSAAPPIASVFVHCGPQAASRAAKKSGVQFGFTLGSYGTGIFLPQIAKGFGLTNLAASLLSAVPYVFASAAMLWWAWRVERTGGSTANLAIACAVGMAELALSVAAENLAVALAALTLALVGITAARAIF
jgi:hypothetical protein